MISKQEEIKFGLGELPDGACNMLHTMSKREMIREVLIQKGYSADLDLDTATWLADAILKYLDSQGVVIKVERELPEEIVDAYDSDGVQLSTMVISKFTQNDMLEAGYLAVESLIKEVT